MERGRKSQLKRLALSVRSEAGFTPQEPIDPRAIATLYGFQVMSLSESGLDAPTLSIAQSSLSDRWSGALVGDGRIAVIIENDFHPRGRRNATVAHEVSHILLEHPLTTRILDERRCGASRTLEVEADELAGELLLPRDAVVRAVLRRAAVWQIAEEFGVSEAFATWRINVTGASRIASRTRSRSNRR
jgi:hypothetical protein